jgi:hypothetical protein
MEAFVRILDERAAAEAIGGSRCRTTPAIGRADRTGAWCSSGTRCVQRPLLMYSMASLSSSPLLWCRHND